jgi:hypothetical protein
MAQYYQALADDEANQHGIAAGRLQVAEAQAKEAERIARNFPSSVPMSSNLSADCGGFLQEITKRHHSTVQTQLQSALRDNDYVYHQEVPAEASLEAVAKLPAAKPIPVS